MSSPAGSDSFEDAENGNAAPDHQDNFLVNEDPNLGEQGGEAPEEQPGEPQQPLLPVKAGEAVVPNENGAVPEDAPNGQLIRVLGRMHRVLGGNDEGDYIALRVTEDEGIGSTDGTSGQSISSPSRSSSVDNLLPPEPQEGAVIVNNANGQPVVHMNNPKQRVEGASNRRRQNSKEAEPSAAVGVGSNGTNGATSLTTSVVDEVAVDESATSSTNTRCLCLRDCARRHPNWPYLVCIASVVAILIIVIILYFVLSSYYQTKLHAELTLKQGRPRFQSPPADLVANIYFFNVDNPWEVESGEEIPHVTQMGPYAYKVDIRRINITWNDNDTVSYRESYKFSFDSERSNGTEEDKITTANIPFVVMHNSLGGAGKFLESMMLSRNARHLLETHTVKEIMWGYKSQLSQEINKKTQLLSSLHLVKQMPTTFGLFADNTTRISEMLNVFTGQNNFSKLNNIYSWDYKTKLSYWSTDEANTIQGTDGSVFKPDISEYSDLVFFNAPLFRIFHLQYKRSHHYHGLNTLRFIIPDSAFANNSKPDTPSSNYAAASPTAPTAPISNRDVSSVTARASSSTVSKSGFCVPHCIPSGVYSIEQCVKAPFYVSLPHFLGADPFYRTQVKGLNPNESEHRPFWDIDQLTGVTVVNRRRHQLNVKIDAGAGKHDQSYLPVVWIDLDARINDDALSQLRKATFIQYTVSILIIVAIGLIVLLFMCSLAFIFNMATRRVMTRPYGQLEVDEATRPISDPLFDRICLCGFCRSSTEEHGIEERVPEPVPV